MNEDVRDVILVLLLIQCVLGFFFGCMQAGFNGHCAYTRVAEFHPAYVVGCELLRDRSKR